MVAYRFCDLSSLTHTSAVPSSQADNRRLLTFLISILGEAAMDGDDTHQVDRTNGRVQGDQGSTATVSEDATAPQTQQPPESSTSHANATGPPPPPPTPFPPNHPNASQSQIPPPPPPFQGMPFAGGPPGMNMNMGPPPLPPGWTEHRGERPMCWYIRPSHVFLFDSLSLSPETQRPRDNRTTTTPRRRLPPTSDPSHPHHPGSPCPAHRP